MSKNKITDGEWKVWSGTFVATNQYQIADCNPVAQFQVPIEEVEANAQLISAAPDLLAACENLLDMLDSVGDLRDGSSPFQDDEDEKIILKAQKAIAKAKGESQS